LRTIVGIVLLGFCLPGCSGKSNIVTSIAINPEHPGILFIATNDSIYKTRDDGATWIPVTEGLGHARIVSLAIHPKQTSTVYAGTLGDAVYRSVDGGNRWSIINAGMKEHVTYVNAFVFHPQDPETILAATTVGIFETKNGGLMWEELSNKGMDSVYVVAAAIDPVETEILFAGTSGGVYKTTNGGMNWVQSNKGLIEGEFRTALALGINSLLMDPADRMTLYAGSTRGLFKTTDGAENWIKIQGGIGETFVAVLLVHLASNSTLFAGTQNGVYKTTDGGDHWTALNNGLANLSVRSLAMHPKDPSVLYAGTQGGLFKTTDGGAHWAALTVRPKG
jgi:photosystem II stability/assembly factor-like uncharacterized protein